MVRTLMVAVALISLVPASALADDWEDEGTYSTYPAAGGDADADDDSSYDDGADAAAAYDDEVEAPAASQQDMFNQYWTSLSPYGRWDNDPSYGWIWYPTSSGFRPYVDGRWVFTTWGWTFVSDLPYGWAVFHYGRWVMTPAGWAWVPGYEWSPAWVSFRHADGYVGWCPLGPRGVVYDYEPYVSYRTVVYSPWVFVGAGSFGVSPIPTVIVEPHRARAIFHGSSWAQYRTHRGVPVYRDLPRVHHAQPVQVFHAAKPVGSGYSGGALSMYRVDRRAAAGAPMRPAWRDRSHAARPYATPAQPSIPARPQDRDLPGRRFEQHGNSSQPATPERRFEHRREEPAQPAQPMRPAPSAPFPARQYEHRMDQPRAMPAAPRAMTINQPARRSDDRPAMPSAPAPRAEVARPAMPAQPAQPAAPAARHGGFGGFGNGNGQGGDHQGGGHGRRQ